MFALLGSVIVYILMQRRKQRKKPKLILVRMKNNPHKKFLKNELKFINNEWLK